MSASTRLVMLPVYRVGLVAWAALLLLQCVWHAWLAPPSQLPLPFVFGLSLVPLLLPLLAIRDVRRALLWVGIASLFYFCHGVSEAWSDASVRPLAVTEILLTLLLIAMLGAGVRRRTR